MSNSNIGGAGRLLSNGNKFRGNKITNYDAD